MALAIVNFRTRPNGAYKWIKRGQRRGNWRVLIVAHETESGRYAITDKNVIRVLAEYREGIDGVTQRSHYCIDDTYLDAVEAAYNWNAAQ